MSSEPKKLLIATRNEGKVHELKGLFEARLVQLLSLSDFENVIDVEETGTTFAENARLKAISYARQTGVTAFADDSGIEVEALNGRPGVFSARYGGESTNFVQKMEMLLAEITQVNDTGRRARFVCSIAVASPAGSVLHSVEGYCDGTIASSPSGIGGFGYDPIFIPDGYDHTFGELPSDIKQKISHRALAFSEIIPFLLDFIAG